MAFKVNLKKYVLYEGKWQFFPVLKKENGEPKPDTILISGKPVKGTSGKFYLEYRHDGKHGKRIQTPCSSSPREAKEAWDTLVRQLNPEFEAELSNSAPIAAPAGNVRQAVTLYLSQVKATKSAATHRAYSSDLAWFTAHLNKEFVGQVTRHDLLRVLGKGRESSSSQKPLNQKTINRRVMVGLMALRNAGASIKMEKGDWPKVVDVDVEKYEPEEITTFFAACNESERLLFQTFLVSGLRSTEVATLTWDDIDFKHHTLRVVPKPQYNFVPKNHERRTVTVPGVLTSLLKEWRKLAGDRFLVFPSPVHPTRPEYGGSGVDSHHLELCKQIAFRAHLNCGSCMSKKSKPTPQFKEVVGQDGKKRKRYYSSEERRTVRACSSGPYCAKWYLHKWRHTYATQMLQSGMDLKTLQKQLDHKSLAVTERYLNAMRDEGLTAKVEASSLAALIA